MRTAETTVRTAGSELFSDLNQTPAKSVTHGAIILLEECCLSTPLPHLCSDCLMLQRIRNRRRHYYYYYYSPTYSCYKRGKTFRHTSNVWPRFSAVINGEFSCNSDEKSVAPACVLCSRHRCTIDRSKCRDHLLATLWPKVDSAALPTGV